MYEVGVGQALRDFSWTKSECNNLFDFYAGCSESETGSSRFYWTKLEWVFYIGIFGGRSEIGAGS